MKYEKLNIRQWQAKVPDILIQRYNRPKLIRLQKKLLDRDKKKEGAVCVY